MNEEMIKLKKLINKINIYANEYYTIGQPTITDEQYDALYDKLLKLEEETGIVLSNSPSQRVGGQVLDKLQKITHEYPLLSLAKTKKIDDIIKFRKGKDIIALLKGDGLTVDIIYDNGELVSGETRGNGSVGELITNNIKQFTNIPLRIPYKGHVHFIGEAEITYDTFEEINAKLPQEKKYKNPRNLIAGTVRQLDSNICKERQAKFFGYIVEGVESLKTKEEQLDFIIKQGFDCIDYRYIKSDFTKEQIEEVVEYLKTIAKEKLIPIDGLVFMYNNIEFGKSLGKTSHHPLHSIAFKFNEDVEFSILRSVEFQVGRTGQITPVAIFDEVELAGSTVSRASLHNISILKSFKLGIGDEIAVVKKNEIIPQIIDNMTKSDTLEIPNVCPVCGHEAIIKKDNESEVLMCTNDNCKAKLVQKISHYVSKNALNVDGFSEATIEKFIDLGYLKSIQDIYYLSSDKCKYKDDIIKLDGFGIKSYKNLVNAINKSKTCKLESFIFGLGISNVGKSTAKNMVEFAKGLSSLDTINNMASLSKHMWTQMKDCGEIVASSIYDWFRTVENLETLGYLTQMELTFIEDEVKETKQGVFTGKSLYCTGTFNCGKKDYLKELVETNGGEFTGGINKDLTYLVVGSIKGSGKEKQARDKGITVLQEDEFLQIIKGN